MFLANDFTIELLLNIEDAQSLFHLMDSNAERFQLFLPKTLSQNRSLEDSKKYIERKRVEISSKSQFTFAIKENSSNEIAGLIIIKKIDYDTKQAEFAYCIGEEFGGKGLISKSISEVVKFSVNELGLKNFQIITHKTNEGSVKVALNNNFTWSETLISEFTPEGKLSLDMELYELSIN